MHRTMRVVVLGLLTVTMSAASAAAEDARWVQYVPAASKRAQLPTRCNVRQRRWTTSPCRCAPAPNPAGIFPYSLLAADHAGRAKLVTIDGIPVPLPVARPNRILLIGDTGCRLKDSFVQACNDFSSCGRSRSARMWPQRCGPISSFTSAISITARPLARPAISAAPAARSATLGRSGAPIFFRRPVCCSRRRLGYSCAAITRNVSAAASAGSARSIPILTIRRQGAMAASRLRIHSSLTSAGSRLWSWTQRVRARERADEQEAALYREQFKSSPSWRRPASSGSPSIA